MKRGRKSGELSARRRDLLIRHIAGNVAYLNLHDLPEAVDAGAKALIDRLSKSQTFAAGEVVCPVPDTAWSLLILRQGSIKIVLPRKPRHTLVKKIGPGSIFGQIELWGQSLENALAVAAEPCEVAILNENAARALLAASPELHLRLTEVNGPNLVEMRQRYRDAAFDPVESRVAKFLLANADEDGVLRGQPHYRIADRLGVHRPTVSKILARMKRDGLIESERGGRIRVLDAQALREMEVIW
jgi:CRP-like cAMP-binding protein